MANRFDKPVESQYVSQYVPIPFEQLYRIGKEYNDRVDKAEKTLSDNIKQWGEFQSKSQKDMESWYGLTKGVVEPLVQRMAQNPDLIKTREGQSAINQLINNIDYASLNKLKQSAEAFKQRDAAISQLIRTGQYNPIWHDLDVSHYDTIGKNQVFNETDPLPYISINDLVRPYVDNLKPSYLRQEGIWDVRGVSRDTTDEMVRQNWSSIFNTPQAQKHIDVLMSMGMDRQQAESEFQRQVYNRAAEAAYEDKQVNPYVLAQIKANGGKNKPNGYTLGQEDILAKDFSDKRQNIISSVLTDSNGNPSAISQKYSELFKKNAEEINEIVSLIQQDNKDFNKALNDSIAALHDRNITGNNAVALALQTAISLTKDTIDPLLLNRLNTLNAQSNQIANDMTDEAYGEYYSRAFNTILGKPINENPFSSLKRETGNGSFFNDTKGQHMWSMALLDTMQEISSSTESEINKELFKSETPKNEKGFLISPNMMLSPKNFIFNSNRHLQKLAKDIDFDVNGTKLDRHSGMIHDGDSNLSLEERVANGDFGKVRVQRIIGYVDTPENRNYVAEVSLPIDEDDSVLGNKMTAWWRWDDIEGAIEDAGYTVIPREDGGKDLILTMIIPETNKSVDKRRRNATYQKQYGVTDTKQIQSELDDNALTNLKNYSIQYGYK